VVHQFSFGSWPKKASSKGKDQEGGREGKYILLENSKVLYKSKGRGGDSINEKPPHEILVRRGGDS